MMKQEMLFKKLGNILSELNDQYQFLSSNPNQLTELELELFLANVNFLADHIQIIKKLRVSTEPLSETDDLAPSTQIEEKKAELPSHEPEHKPEPEDLQVENFEFEARPSHSFEFIINKDSYHEDRFDFEEKDAEQLFDRPLTEEESRIIKHRKELSTQELVDEQRKKVKENLVRNPAELVEDEIGPEPFLSTETIAEKPIISEKKPNSVQNTTKAAEPRTTETILLDERKTETKPSLNDVLAANQTSNRGLNHHLQENIVSLKSSISLNDKLLYIKDLFNGYNLAYAEAIEIVDKMPNFDSADNFLQKNYAAKNNWSEKQATVDRFYLLLNRRFKD